MKSTNMIITAIIVALVAAGGGFFGGVQYQKGKQPPLPAFGQRGNLNFNGSARQHFGNGGAVRGTVAAIQDKTMTVKLQDGGSKLVILNDSTIVEKTATGTLSDVFVGQAIAAVGTANSDGSVTAQNVQLNPVERGIPGAPPGQ